MNNDMLRQVAAAIELEPEAFDMTLWLSNSNDTLCGTVACVAGTTVLQDPEWRAANQATYTEIGAKYYSYDDADLPQVAARMLGLAPLPESEDNPLFVSCDWWAKAAKFLGLPGPTTHERMGSSIGWITAKHAATVLYALADGTITIEQFACSE